MSVKTKAMEQAEHAWIREFLPADHAVLFIEGGPMDEWMWLYQVAMDGYRGYHLIEGIIKPNLNLTAAPEARRYFLARYDQIVTMLEAAKVPFAKMPELSLTANFYRPPAGESRFVDFEAGVKIELLYR